MLRLLRKKEEAIQAGIWLLDRFPLDPIQNRTIIYRFHYISFLYREHYSYPAREQKVKGASWVTAYIEYDETPSGSEGYESDEEEHRRRARRRVRRRAEE